MLGATKRRSRGRIHRSSLPENEGFWDDDETVDRPALGFLALAAVILVVDAITTPRHRLLDTAVLALMAADVAFDWIRGRGAKTG